MTPTLEEIKEHFSRAKEIRCLSLDIIVDVSTVVNYTYDEKKQEWKSIGNMVCFWKNGRYADITKKKCNPAECKGCKPCAEKRKLM